MIIFLYKKNHEYFGSLKNKLIFLNLFA